MGAAYALGAAIYGGVVCYVTNCGKIIPAAIEAAKEALESLAVLDDELFEPQPLSMGKKSQKERATDVPSWTRGMSKDPNEDCDKFATRVLNNHYGVNHPKALKRGANSEHSKIKKYCERGQCS